jgi:putative ABC transport system permease protein
MKLRLPSFVRRLIAVVTWRHQDEDMHREMTFHVDSITREYVRAGMSEAEAARAAGRRFGSVLRHKEAGHDVRTAHLELLVEDVKSGLRQLTNAPAFAVVAAVTLALGIGVNGAVFAVVKSVMLDALPYPDADRLVRIHGGTPDRPQQGGPLSAGTVNDIGTRQQSFSSLAAFTDRGIEAVYGGDDGPLIATIAWVEPQLFETLGVSTALGRAFHRSDALDGLVPLSGGQLAPDAASAVIVTHGAWTRLFATDPGVIGREVRVNGIPRTVVGVLPRGFVGPMGDVDFYFAFDLGPVLANPIAVRRSQWLGLVGRLKSGVSHDAAKNEVAGIWSNLAREYAADNGTLSATAIPLRDAMVGDTRRPLIVLMASAGLVLLITCANLAATLLSRALSRRKEFAVRTALGAGRGRLVRQLLTESTVLGLAGGAAGMFLAALILSLLGELAPRVLPDYADPSLDWGAVIVTAAVALFSGLLFGVVPALSVDRANTQSTLCDESRGSSESLRSRRLRGALVAGQIALCVSLLAGTGLLSRSLWAMTDAPLGFDADAVLTGSVQLPPRNYATPQSRFLFREQFEERLRSLPGVQAVATASSIPTVVRQRAGITLEGAPANEAQPFVLLTVASDNYFRALGIPVRQGRTFDARDRPDAPPTVVVSESLARRFWPAGDALGTRIRLGPDRRSPLIEVIGIVGDVRNDRARLDSEPMAYRPSRQIPAPIVTFALRTEGEPLALVRPVERELAAIDRGLPLQQVRTLQAVLGEGLAGRRLPVLLMTAFGGLALLLASVGIYSLFTSMAAAREREFGVRLALGSRPGAIAVLVLRQGAAWMAAGLIIGAFGIVLVVRLVRDLLFGISPFDPITLGLSIVILAVCATIALLLPLIRATRVDAAVALRAQ